MRKSSSKLKLLVICLVIIVCCVGVLLPGCEASENPLRPNKVSDSRNKLEKLTGTYVYEQGRIIITCDNEALYFYDSVDGSYRKLKQHGNFSFSAGPALLVRAPETISIKFETDPQEQNVSGLEVRKEKAPVFLARKQLSRTKEKVSFQSGNLALSGDLYLPNKSGKVPAVVLVHGSGEQDRNGYLNFMALMAEHFANAGIAVLTYDKRGVGRSQGDWQSAGFNLLAEDALAALNFLQSREDLQTDFLGLWGSSQAGWVMAEAVNRKKDIDFVISVSAAGMGITPAEQNLFYLETELNKRGYSKNSINRIIVANQALYDLVRKKITTAEYKSILEKSRGDYWAGSWLPPSPEQIDRKSKKEWFLALDIDFDSRQIWSNYKGSLLAVFGEGDTLTPSEQIVAEVEKYKSKQSGSAEIEIVPGANHLLMLIDKGKSADDFGNSKRFAANVLERMAAWVNNRFAEKQRK